MSVKNNISLLRLSFFLSNERKDRGILESDIFQVHAQTQSWHQVTFALRSKLHRCVYTLCMSNEENNYLSEDVKGDFFLFVPSSMFWPR